jgi:hypothetical protein
VAERALPYVQRLQLMCSDWSSDEKDAAGISTRFMTAQTFKYFFMQRTQGV